MVGDVGTQKLNFRYKGELTSENFSRLLYGITTPGIIDGFTASMADEDTVTLTVGKLYINSSDGSNYGIKCETTVNFDIDVTSASNGDYIVARYTRTEDETTDYVEFLCLASASIDSNYDIKIAKIVTKASNIIEDVRQYSISSLNLKNDGAVTTTTDILSLTNNANSSAMTATGTGILFNQRYYDATDLLGARIVNSGRISVITEGNWASDGASQDSTMIFETALNGTLTERLNINSLGTTNIVASGTTTSSIDGLQLTNTAVGGTATATALTFIHTDSTSALQDSGKIEIINTDTYTGTPSTQDTKMAFYTQLNGTLTDNVEISSDGILKVLNNVIDMTTHKITNLATPTADTDAVTKLYVDDKIIVTTFTDTSGEIDFTMDSRTKYFKVLLVGGGGKGGDGGGTDNLIISYGGSGGGGGSGYFVIYENYGSLHYGLSLKITVGGGGGKGGGDDGTSSILKIDNTTYTTTVATAFGGKGGGDGVKAVSTNGGAGGAGGDGGAGGGGGSGGAPSGASSAGAGGAKGNGQDLFVYDVNYGIKMVYGFDGEAGDTTDAGDGGNTIYSKGGTKGTYIGTSSSGGGGGGYLGVGSNGVFTPSGVNGLDGLSPTENTGAGGSGGSGGGGASLLTGGTGGVGANGIVILIEYTGIDVEYTP